MTTRSDDSATTITLDSECASVRALSLRGDKQLAFRRWVFGNAQFVLEDGMSPFASEPVEGGPTVDARPPRRLMACDQSSSANRNDPPPAPLPSDTAQTSFALPRATTKADAAAARRLEAELAALRALFGTAD